MATQSQYNVMIQPYRDIDIRIEVLDFNLYVIDDINGFATSASFSINADSDIRRTCTIDMVLKDNYNINPIKNDIYYNSGNPFWFDKFLKISIGIKDITNNEIVWHNQGVYLINQPSIKYDAQNNSLSFDGVDLMAKLTGMRNGNLEGMGYTIPIGSQIRNAMINILAEQGFTNYVINVPPQATTPYEIRVEAGGTSYNLLTSLRDINPTYEMFFDVNGVFYFQEIAKDFQKDEYVAPFVNKEALEVLNISYQLDTSFEEVKNYIEVYGKALDATRIADNLTYSADSSTLQIVLGSAVFEEGVPYDYSFTLGNLELSPSTRINPIDIIRISCGAYSDVYIFLDDSTAIKYDNMSYIIRVVLNGGNLEAEYLGYTQPFGMAWDDNEYSPFYVGVETSFPPYSYPVNYTDAVYNKPQFERQVRIVLSGGEYDNIYSNELAIQRAKYELYLRSRLHDNIQITLVPIYWMDVNQVIEYQLPNENEPSYWLVKSVSTSFGVSGTQTITASRYYIEQ